MLKLIRNLFVNKDCKCVERLWKKKWLIVCGNAFDVNCCGKMDKKQNLVFWYWFTVMHNIVDLLVVTHHYCWIVDTAPQNTSRIYESLDEFHFQYELWEVQCSKTIIVEHGIQLFVMVPGFVGVHFCTSSVIHWGLFFISIRLHTILFTENSLQYGLQLINYSIVFWRLQWTRRIIYWT